MQWSAKVAVGLDKLIKDFDLNGLTYYYRGLNGNAFEELGAGLIVGNSLLTARGIPASGEGDLKTISPCLSWIGSVRAARIPNFTGWTSTRICPDGPRWPRSRRHQ